MSSDADRAAGRRQQTPRARLGASGERVAAHALEASGCRIVARNWRCRAGEVDLIAEDGAELVFVEVKTRRGAQLGSPEEAVTPRKRQRLIAAAQTYLAEQDAEQRPYRIDVVAVELGPSGRVSGVRLHQRAVAEE
jgi:putative endonuclease